MPEAAQRSGLLLSLPSSYPVLSLRLVSRLPHLPFHLAALQCHGRQGWRLWRDKGVTPAPEESQVGDQPHPTILLPLTRFSTALSTNPPTLEPVTRPLRGLRLDPRDCSDEDGSLISRRGSCYLPGSTRASDIIVAPGWRGRGDTRGGCARREFSAAAAPRDVGISYFLAHRDLEERSEIDEQ